MNTIDLTTRYLGLELTNPVMVSACPLTGEVDVLKRLADHGAAAAVLPSLFAEQLDDVNPKSAAQSATFPDGLAYFHELKEYNGGPETYLKHVAAAKRAVSIPIIGSLNVTRPGEWIHYARRIEEAGADALELNAYFLVTDFDVSSRDVEAHYAEVVAAVRQEIKIPLAVKLGPQFTAFPNVARRLAEAGADGLVLFNRFLQPEIDLDTMRVVPRLALSTAEETREVLRWIALLHGRLPVSLAATTGIHFADDAIRMLLAGADVVMVASTLYRHGVEVLQKLIEGIAYWLQSHDYREVSQIRGILSLKQSPDPAAFARANYTKAISAFASGSDKD